MQKFIFTMLLVLSAQPSFAGYSNCAFPYDLAESGGVNDLRAISIDENTDLTSLQAYQLSQFADKWAAGMDYDGYLNLQQAISVLKSDSEGGDLVITIFEFEGEVYSVIQIFPGGNPFGVIFKGPEAIAERHDGDIYCY